MDFVSGLPLTPSKKDSVWVIVDQLPMSGHFIQKKVLRFERKVKLSPMFIGPYRILRRVGPVAYQLELALELDQEIEVRPDMTFEEEPVQILDRDVKILRKKSIPLLKVLWKNHSTEEAT
ncbi:uncharacterized protein LOC108474923 [Gossypium arboreum]|uniref:uncharacterized protein LOC108474923 n=1 Tax=Gossypium arboreum TaxID=29729 RepID=UPI0008194E35|nr:uncharacterized protein LOC108474923 [Gossypium arboreum]